MIIKIPDPEIIYKDLQGTSLGQIYLLNNVPTIIIQEDLPLASKKCVIEHELHHLYCFRQSTSAVTTTKKNLRLLKETRLRKVVRRALDEEEQAYRRQSRELLKHEGQEMHPFHQALVHNFKYMSRRKFRKWLEKLIKVEGKTQAQYYRDQLSKYAKGLK